MNKTITKVGAARLKAAPRGQRYEVYDALIPGFGLRVTDRGRKSWFVMYRYRGHQRRHTLGTYPALKVEEARESAREILLKARKGIDPKDAELADACFELVSKDFIEKHARRKTKTWQETRHYLERMELRRWRSIPVDEITRRDVLEVLDRMVREGKPYAANRLFGIVRKLFNWCIERGIVTASPVAGMKRPAKEKTRERTLDEEEIRAIWDAADDYPFGTLTRFLLTTGQRLNEAAKMRWNDVQGNRWTITTTKSGRPHEVPLSPLALEILTAIPRFDGPHVFTSTAGAKPVSGFSRAKRRLDEDAGVTDWRFHDLRRTCTTGLARLGVAPHVCQRILNHSAGPISGVGAVYNRYGYADEKADALTVWAEYLRGILADTVVAIGTRHAN